jgi:hypothetical protein
MWISGDSGASYGAEIPVKSVQRTWLLIATLRCGKAHLLFLPPALSCTILLDLCLRRLEEARRRKPPRMVAMTDCEGREQDLYLLGMGR